MQTEDGKELLVRYFSNEILNCFEKPSSKASSPPPQKAWLQKSWRVASSAVYIFRKFFQENEMIDYDPRLVMLSAIFMSGKIENHRIKMQEIFDIITNKYSIDKVLGMEIHLFQHFAPELKFYHPQNLIKTIFNDFYVNSSMSSSDPKKKVELEQLASQAMRNVQLTKAIIDFSPLVVAIFVLLKTMPQTEFKEYLRSGQYFKDIHVEPLLQKVIQLENSIFKQEIETWNEKQHAIVIDHLVLQKQVAFLKKHANY